MDLIFIGTRVVFYHNTLSLQKNKKLDWKFYYDGLKTTILKMHIKAMKCSLLIAKNIANITNRLTYCTDQAVAQIS